ncbi:putative uracil phosphoribosyltransferase [Violaceomyces palustris]|uniref:Uracil phosphoribosyltransferase n=1 Tax=Violaceomyces palustris TaxID=1673888 RepID=A0ACD0P2P5_9BASI|nr:putative uracil phosphoribosyltransferase [Violaceomyces palustris]
MAAYTPPAIDGLHLVSHPLISHQLANLRLKSTGSKEFRALVANISSILCIEATRNLETVQVQGEGPLATFTGEEIKPKVGLVPILRAGLGMTDACLELLPENTTVLHIGLFREKVSLQPVEYYNKLPAVPTVNKVFILDPLIATGGTAIACVQMILDWGVPISDIKFLCVLGSETGIRNVLKACPGLELWVGSVDPQLSEKGLILPGLGDTGDRLFNTTA